MSRDIIKEEFERRKAECEAKGIPFTSLHAQFFGRVRRVKTRILLDDLSGLRIEYRPRGPSGVEAISFRRYAPAQQFDTAWQAARAAWAEILRNNTEGTL